MTELTLNEFDDLNKEMLDCKLKEEVNKMDISGIILPEIFSGNQWQEPDIQFRAKKGNPVI